ncbi:DinB family protein [Streptomyces sp. PTM05]|uniref:DinB family protein n=1 Tax=Streptantibioticus parmotrematis TaxID=2873249 RepID=A0ABS7QJQ0_9ACTN|nr:DUF664 domain-containing protein [Streptantibioticus parmotrematis]MBY8883406.1 DinB family protein [Streptantibioticus parmotrematis]
MNVADLLTDAFERVHASVHDAVEGLSADRLATRPEGSANSIAWLVWHLTRVQDDHVSDAEGVEQAWTAQGWADRFGLPFSPSDTGYGHSGDEVAAVRASAKLLTGYHDAVHERTLRYVGGLSGHDLDRIVDDAWDPPVTLGVRLVSVVNDATQHVGQAAFVRGSLLNG